VNLFQTEAKKIIFLFAIAIMLLMSVQPGLTESPYNTF
jgi:hypothetical protein